MASNSYAFGVTYEGEDYIVTVKSSAPDVLGPWEVEGEDSEDFVSYLLTKRGIYGHYIEESAAPVDLLAAFSNSDEIEIVVNPLGSSSPPSLPVGAVS